MDIAHLLSGINSSNKDTDLTDNVIVLTSSTSGFTSSNKGLYQRNIIKLYDYIKTKSSSDPDGFVIKSGDTMSGQLINTANGGFRINGNYNNTNHQGGFIVGATAGNLGLYDYTNSKWIAYSTMSGAVNLNGNANTATTLATGRTLKVDLTSTSVSTAFDGSANIADIGVSGVLPIANGGIGSATVAPNKIFAGPSSGSSNAAPSFRSLVAADIPALDYVPTTRKINNKALSSDITLTASDVSAVPTTRKVNGNALSSDVTLTYNDVGAAASGHTHTTSLAVDTGTSSVTLDYGEKYKLTAGGTNVIFTMPASDNVDEKVKSDLTSSATSYYLTGTTSQKTTVTGTLVRNNGIQGYTTASDSTDGYASLRLGNSTISGNTGAQYGAIRLYGKNDKYVVLKTNALTDTRTITLPDAGGTIALTDDLDSYVLKSGDTMTGNLNLVNKKEVILQDTASGTTPTRKFSLCFSTSSNDKFGMYNYTNSKWMLYSDTSGNAVFNGTASVATKVSITEESSTTEVSRRLVISPVTAGDNTLYTNNMGALLVGKKGTDSVTGYNFIRLGNDTATGTADNTEGYIRLYGTGSKYTNIKASNASANRTITFPDATGTVALTSDLDNYLPLNGNAATATQVYVTKVNDATQYYPVFSAIGSGNANLKNTDQGFSITQKVGTASDKGWIELHIGNSTASGTANNRQGWIKLYGPKAYGTEISNLQETTNNFAYLPNYNGTMYFAHTGNANAVGSDTTPAYVAANGRLTECTNNTAIKVKISATAPTSATNRRIVLTSNDTGDSQTLYNNANGAMIQILTGTTSTDGYNTLILGNSTASGTASNAYGGVRLYGTGTTYSTLRSPNVSSSRTVYIYKISGGTAEPSGGENGDIYIRYS